MNTETGARVASFVRQHWPKHAEKELQRAFDISEATAERVLAGTVSKALLERMFSKFGWRFANFILTPLCGPSNLPIRTYPAHYWSTKTGIVLAEQGHGYFIRQHVGLKDNGQDFSLFAVRNLGFVQVTRNGSTLKIRYSEQGASSHALEYLAGWLTLDCGQVTSIVRRVETSDGFADHLDASLSDCALALRRIVTLREKPKATWTVERARLSEIRRADFIDVVKAQNDNADPTPTVAKLGLIDLASIFRIDGANVTPIWNGARLDIPRDYVGRNVLDRPSVDAPYAALVHRRILEAQKEGATFYRLNVDINGRRRRYDALALRCADNRVITCADLSEEARRA